MVLLMPRWDIPDSWEWSSAGEVAEIVGGGTPKANDPTNFDENGIPWLTPADLSGYESAYISHGARSLSEKGYDTCAAKVLPKNTVLYTSRAPIGYCAIASNEICTNQGFKSLVLGEGLSPRFTRHYLIASKEYAESLSSGSTFKELSGTRMKGVEFPIAPSNEQRRIADKIDALQAKSRRAREALEVTKPLLEKFRQSVLASAFRGDLTAQWRTQNPDVEPATKLLERIRAERRARWEEAELAKMQAKGKEPKNDKWKAKYKEPESVDTSELPELPGGWCWSNIGELFHVGVGATPSRKEPDYWNGDVPWVSSGEVAFCRIAETNEYITELGLANASTEIHPIGTVLVGMIGEGKTRGQTAILDIEACNNQNSAAIRVSETEISPEFVYRFFEYQYAKTRSIGSGNNQPALNKGRVQAIAIPVPPIEEIQCISLLLEEKFTQIYRFEELNEPLVDQIDRLDQSILAKAFRGELVPQDPNDEPASVLLERIKAEREAAKGKKKRRRKKG